MRRSEEAESRTPVRVCSCAMPKDNVFRRPLHWRARAKACATYDWRAMAGRARRPRSTTIPANCARPVDEKHMNGPSFPPGDGRAGGFARPEVVLSATVEQERFRSTDGQFAVLVVRVDPSDAQVV